jgi:hypothetical protein
MDKMKSPNKNELNLPFVRESLYPANEAHAIMPINPTAAIWIVFPKLRIK